MDDVLNRAGMGMSSAAMLHDECDVTGSHAPHAHGMGMERFRPVLLPRTDRGNNQSIILTVTLLGSTNITVPAHGIEPRLPRLLARTGLHVKAVVL
jgi:hypothetical protein